MKFLRTLFFLVVLVNSVHSQTKNNVFDLKKLTWFGVDCSHLKFIGSYAEWGDKNRLVEIYMPAWNNVILNEPKKFNLSYNFNSCDIEVDIKKATALNALVSTDSLVNLYHRKNKYLNEIQIQDHILNNYKSNEHNGWGVVFLPENFDGYSKLAMIDVVIFDIATGKVELMKRLSSVGGGVGIRNYWVNTMHTCLNTVRKEWKHWSKNSQLKK